MIEIRNVSLWYGKKFKAVDDVSAVVRDGRTVVLCGPSGSGKSSLLRCINGLERFQEGEILVDGVSVQAKTTQIHRLRSNIGMVFQHFELYPHMTALGNITLAPIRVARKSRKEAEEKAMELLERMGIRGQAHKYPGELSGGQQQRVAIARALAMEPEVMLFDEPTSALDPEMIKEVLDAMLELSAAGMTMIVVTHEMNFAKRAADEIIFMADGRIVERNDTQMFFEQPQTERARQFLDRLML